MSLILWLVVLAAALALEVVGLIKPRDRWLTLTEIINRWVPPVLIAAALAWLTQHFLV